MNTKRSVLMLIVLLALALSSAACAGTGQTIANGTVPTGAAPAEELVASDSGATPSPSNPVEVTRIVTEVIEVTRIVEVEVTPVPSPTVVPTATPVNAEDFLIDPSCILLQDGDVKLGTACFPRDVETPDYRIPVAEGGFSFVALGSGELDGKDIGPVAEDIGHIILFVGSKPDGSTPRDLNQGVTLSDYIAGSVAVTHITRATEYDDALDEVQKHAEGMLEDAPSCGAEACNEVYFWIWDWEKGEYKLIEKLESDNNA